MSKTSWEDVEIAFEPVNGADLGTFEKERKAAPHLAYEEPATLGGTIEDGLKLLALCAISVGGPYVLYLLTR